MPIPKDETAGMLCAALREQPVCATTAGALRDRYIEMGESPKTAEVWVMRRVRWYACLQAITGSSAKAAKLRTRICRRVGAPPCVDISLVGNERADEGPQMTGEAPHSTFRGGGECKYPGAAIRAGYKVDYHPDTRKITVGVTWLYSLISEEFSCLL